MILNIYHPEKACESRHFLLPSRLTGGRLPARRYRRVLSTRQAGGDGWRGRGGVGVDGQGVANPEDHGRHPQPRLGGRVHRNVPGDATLSRRLGHRARRLRDPIYGIFLGGADGDFSNHHFEFVRLGGFFRPNAYVPPRTLCGRC